MAATAVTPTVVPMETNELLPTAVAGGASNAGWIIANSPYPAERVLLVFVADGTNADTIKVQTPTDTTPFNNSELVPTVTAGLGDLSFALAATETRCVVVEGARHQFSDGIHVVNTQASGATKCYALITPLGGGPQNGL